MCQAVICARAQLLLWGGSSVVLLLLKADGVLLCCWPTAGDGASWLAAKAGKQLFGLCEYSYIRIRERIFSIRVIRESIFQFV